MAHAIFNTWESATLNGHTLKDYDELYPLTSNDSVRTCSWYKDRWSKDEKSVTHYECGRRFFQWNQQANREPWAVCEKHSVKVEDPRKGKKKYD